MIDTNDIFKIQTEAEFQLMALKIFRQQFEHNKVYRSYCDLLYVNPSDVNSLQQIPFLPIDFFKTHRVLSSEEQVRFSVRSW